MFFLTSEIQEVFDAAHTYPFGEEFDREIEESLYQHLAMYVKVLPQKFQSAVMERTLFRNDVLMDAFKVWCSLTIERITAESNVRFEKREAIVERFHPSAQRVFSQSFHDGEVLHAEQQGSDFTLLLDMSGGFTVESIVQVVFHNARTEGKLEGYYVYDELIETEDGYALRVLSSLGSPYSEWTIYFKEVKATSLYRPPAYIEPGEIVTWDEYVNALNQDGNYYILENNEFVEIDLASLSQTGNGIFAGYIQLGDNYEEARERIFCDVYEDPYAHLSEPIPIDELLTAMFDPDQNIQVRAFNTVFALGEDVSSIVNAALRKTDANVDDDMYFDILASHFDQLGCLEDDVKQKWISD